MTMPLSDFLDAVVTADGPGWFCLCLAQKNGGGWADNWYKWPDDKATIISRAISCAADWNVYFSTYLFKSQRRTKDNVLPSRTIQADLDEADIKTLSIAPSILLETSPGRHQGVWLLKDTLPVDAHEALSRKLTYSIDKADTAGWPVGHTMRMPDTLNHKYIDGAKRVIILISTLNVYEQSTFELLPDADKPGAQEDEAWLGATKAVPGVGPHEILALLGNEKKLPPKIIAQYVAAQPDRSAALWALELALFRAGLDRDTVFFVAKHSANNKFADLRYHGDRELSKDVLRAQAIAQRKFPDARAAVREMRHVAGATFVKHQQIANLVLQVMQSEGEFVHTTGNALWYIKRDIGRPVYIGKASEYLNALLDVQFGLNCTETEHAYTKHALITHAVGLPDTTRTAVMSYYNATENTLSVHTGTKDVIRVAANAMDKVNNGAGDIMFPWNNMSEPFVPDYSPIVEDGRTREWHEIVFGDAFEYVVNMQPQDAGALMRVWMHFILFRDAAYTRPILAFFGAPGAGKSTIMRRMYKVLYGARRDLMVATTQTDFDLASTKDPLLVLDNADTWQKWLPDSLAASIANTELDHRKLYTDDDRVTWRRQAIIGVTAHNPKFVREDVADRLLLFTFKRIPNDLRRDEIGIHDAILKHRNRIWGALLKEAQAVLHQPVPQTEDTPRFRIQDFAVVGLRVARALGIADAFSRALGSVTLEQRLFSLEEDSLLVNAIKNMLLSDIKHNNGHVERSTGMLWNTLEAASGNIQTFDHIYHSAAALSKKLVAMQEPLSELFDVHQRLDTVRGTKFWSFAARNGTLEALEKHASKETL